MSMGFSLFLWEMAVGNESLSTLRWVEWALMVLVRITWSKWMTFFIEVPAGVWQRYSGTRVCEIQREKSINNAIVLTEHFSQRSKNTSFKTCWGRLLRRAHRADNVWSVHRHCYNTGSLINASTCCRGNLQYRPLPIIFQWFCILLFYACSKMEEQNCYCIFSFPFCCSQLRFPGQE